MSVLRFLFRACAERFARLPWVRSAPPPVAAEEEADPFYGGLS
jgi:hypothetical protein